MADREKRGEDENTKISRTKRAYQIQKNKNFIVLEGLSFGEK